MRMKKISSLALVMLLVIAMLAAGGGAGAESQPEGDVEVITAMYVGTSEDSDYPYYTAFVEEFNATNNLGVRVEMEFYENEQYKTKLATLMAANEVPDMFFTWELGYLQPFVEGGKVYDLTDMLAADPDYRDSFQEGVLDPLTYGERVYAIPSQTAFTPVFYNKTIFEENNVTVPTTWDEFLAVCETLKNNGVIPISIPCPDAWVPSQFMQQIAMGVGGYEVYTGLLDGTVPWNNESFVQSGVMVQEMIDKGYLQDGFLGMSKEEGEKLMEDGKCAMYLQGSWSIGTFEADGCAVKGQVGAFPLPALNAENANVLVGSVDTCMAISASSKNPEAAFELIKFWTSPAQQEVITYDLGRIPCTNIEIDRTRVSELMAECLEINDKIVALAPWLDRAFGAGEGVEYNNTCQAVFGGENPQQAFDTLKKYIDDNL